VVQCGLQDRRHRRHSTRPSGSIVHQLARENQTASTLRPWITVILECHSERSEAATQRTKSARPGFPSLATSGPIMHHTEMFESPASCFAFRCSALLNMTALSSDGTLAQEITACTGWRKGTNKVGPPQRHGHAEEFLNFGYQSTTKPAMKTISSHLQRDDWTRTAFHRK
jgi:hypothetical protein